MFQALLDYLPAAVEAAKGFMGGGASRQSTSSNSSATNSTNLTYTPIISSNWGTMGEVMPSGGGITGSPSASTSGYATAAGNDGARDAAWGNLPFGTTLPRAVRYDVDQLPGYSGGSLLASPQSGDNTTMLMMLGLGAGALMLMND